MYNTKVWHIIALLYLCLFTVNCQEQENEEDEIIIPQLDGEVVFLHDHQIKSSNINSLDQAISHASAYNIYPKWSNDGTKFAYIAVEVDVGSRSVYLKIVDYKSGITSKWEIVNSIYDDISGQFSWSPDDHTVIILGSLGSYSFKNTVIYLDILTWTSQNQIGKTRNFTGWNY
jgi:hypothetical protein